MSATCPCGQPATSTLYLHFRSPRQQYEPMATDPWYVHGSAPCRTCGAVGCEAAVYAELLARHPGADVQVGTEPGFGILTD